MFDTINFRLTQAEVEGCNFFDEVTPYLEKTKTDEPVIIGGEPYITGNLGREGLTIQNECITELDKKIAEAIKYYR